MEYKREFKFSDDKDKKEMLAHICAFASAEGGAILYGIEDEKDDSGKNSGIPKQIIGLKINTDEVIRSLDESIRKSIEPTLIGIRIEERIIDGKTVLVLFIPVSSNPPHRVIFKGKNEFWKRGNGLKYKIPIEELRADFLKGSELSKRISEFRSERIMKILSNDTPVILQTYPKLVLHIIPVDFFDNNQVFEGLSQFKETEFNPIGLLSSKSLPNGRLNFDGYVAYVHVENGHSLSYTQVFRNAVIESVDIFKITYDLDSEITPNDIYNGPKKGNLKPSCEKYVIKALDLYCSALVKRSINGPCVVFLSLLGIKGYKMYKNPKSVSPLDQEIPIDRENLLLPDMYIKDINNFSAPEVMKPAFDMIWNACGYSGSKNYDKDGQWISS